MIRIITNSSFALCRAFGEFEVSHDYSSDNRRRSLLTSEINSGHDGNNEYVKRNYLIQMRQRFNTSGSSGIIERESCYLVTRQ